MKIAMTLVSVLQSVAGYGKVEMAWLWMVWTLVAIWWLNDWMDYKEEMKERKGA